MHKNILYFNNVIQSKGYNFFLFMLEQIIGQATEQVSDNTDPSSATCFKILLYTNFNYIYHLSVKPGLHSSACHSEVFLIIDGLSHT